MISRYLEKALSVARYEVLEDGSVCAVVPGLRGVIAIGLGVEACRRDLAEVVADWVRVRIARGLVVPRLGDVRIES